ncbi:membrane protein [Marinobacterium nitratireducens]|uniref:Membrane protein n=1 Tax=Marinobacterium nitratireducens TaxID=518897 RepID=A0A918DSU2_9GAMM|nr:DUF2956 domain-containing protein [Marinobacterium nitratireducens]GGO81433.1 membrane protein [Marinobacterium nitratireducens]
MVRYSKQQSPSAETQDEAMKIARANQRPGQTKEQTKLIAQGIQKGIAEYKKQQKAKSREADKQRKQAARHDSDDAAPDALEAPQLRPSPLPWILLILSWLLFGAYFIVRPF